MGKNRVLVKVYISSRSSATRASTSLTSTNLLKLKTSSLISEWLFAQIIISCTKCYLLRSILSFLSWRSKRCQIPPMTWLEAWTNRSKKLKKSSNSPSNILRSLSLWALLSPRESSCTALPEQERLFSPEPLPTILIAHLSGSLGPSWFRSTSERVQEWSESSLWWPVSTHLASSSSTRSTPSEDLACRAKREILKCKGLCLSCWTS